MKITPSTEAYFDYLDELIVVNYHNTSFPVEQRPGDEASFSHLRWMLSELKSMETVDGKFHRWLGFVQGVLVAVGVTTVQEQLDRTRSLFS